MKRNILLVIVSFAFSFLIFYLIFFTYNLVKKHKNNPYLFKSIDDVKFNKYYSKKLHHLRGHNKIKNKKNTKDYIFSVVNNFDNKSKKVLMQGDSWVEQLVEIGNDRSYKEIYNFTHKNNIGFINSGTTSYSPSLMQIQYEILEKDFDIKPNIVIAYIDQTDVGDEICRYKNNRVYKDKKLVAVRNTNYSRAVFEYTKINEISEIFLSENSKLLQNYKLTNFFIEYGYKRFLNKINNIKIYGWENREIYKCHFSEVIKYLRNINESDLKYFENRINDYLNYLLDKEYIENIIIVTFPHYNHLYEERHEFKYNINVSNIIDKIIKNNNKVNHLNFSKLIKDKIFVLNKESYKNDKAHIKEKYYIEIFLKELKNKILDK